MGKKYRVLDWLGTILIIAIMLVSYVSISSFNRFIDYAPFATFAVLAIFFFNHVNIVEAFIQKDMELLFIMVCVLVSLINIYLLQSGVGIAVVLLNLLLILYLSDKIIVENKIIYSLAIVSFILLLSWIGKGARGFNTNHASMIIFALAAAAVAGGVAWLDNKGYAVGAKLVFGVIWLLMVLPLVVALRARGIVLGIAAVIIFGLLLPAKAWKISWFYKGGIILLLISSIAIPIGYIAMKKSGVDISVQVLGKNFFTGRDTVWEQFLTAFLKEPWTGIGSNLAEKIPNVAFTEAHNGFLNVLVVYGVFLFGGFIIYLYKKIIKSIEKAAESLSGRIALGTILSMFVISFFENYVFISPYCLTLMILFFVTNRKKEEKNTN